VSEDIKFVGEVTVEFTCDECGQALDTSQRTGRWDEVTVLVEPCHTCVEAARAEEGRG
jgi:hypothetical protein